MTDEIVEPKVDIDENEPVFYNASTLNLVASSARILSWVVFIIFVLIVAGNIYNLRELAQGETFINLVKSASPRLWMITNLVTPFFTGVTFFVVLQGVCNIIDALLEVDFNTREAK
jgi:uncharacterized protein YhhL (DUF1145 family)